VATQEVQATALVQFKQGDEQAVQTVPLKKVPALHWMHVFEGVRL
jgi:hypothetical protein